MGKWVHRISDIDEAGRVGVCANCGPVKLKRKKKPNGSFRWACRPNERRWRKPNRGSQWTAEQWRERERLILAQGGRCGLCKLPAEPLCMDHCHATGQIRGVLCRACNAGIGFFKDDAELLRAASEYLASG